MKAKAAIAPIVLIALATGAAAYAYLIDRDKVSDSERAVRRRDVFPSFRVEDVRRIEVTHGGERLVLEREQDAGGASVWAMTSPRRERADGATVDALLRELEMGNWLRKVTDGDSLGLSAPRATGEIAMGPLEYRFALGADASKPEGAAYMKLEGEGTFVIGRSLAVQLLRGADAYRERAIVPFGGNDVARMEVRGVAREAFVLERHGATFRTKGGLRASRVLVDRMLMALADARAEAFLDDAAADEGTKEPVLTLLVGAQDASRPGVEIRVGSACPGRPDDQVVVRTSPTRLSACASKGLVEALHLDAASVPDASLFFARADEIEELRLEPAQGEGPTVDLARKGTSWHERVPDDRDLTAEEGDSASALAASLVGARGTDPHLPGPSETMVPFARASLVRVGGTREMVELARPGADGTALVRRIDDGALLRVRLPVVRHLLARPIALRPRPIWRSSFDPASVIAIDDTCGPAPQRLELHDHSWTMVAPSGFAADPVAASDLASAVAHAKADAWIADADDGSFGFQGPGSCTVGLSLASPSGEPSRRVAVVFGASGEGGVYGRTLDDPAVFVAPTVLHDLVSHPAIDASAFRANPGELTSLALEHAGSRLRFTRQGSTLVREGSTVEDAGGEDPLLKALSSLYALAALHPGPSRKEEGADHPTLVLDLTNAKGRTHLVVGSSVQIDGVDTYFARAAGTDATFAVPKAPVDALLSGWNKESGTAGDAGW